ncbi:MAG: hypothetical protein Kow0049_12770 [Stanieria sp.]|jgi:hypothetical protein
MSDLSPKKPTPPGKSQLSPEKYARLRAEAKAPYRGLRKFFYLAFGASGLIGAFVFLAQLAAGKEVSSTLTNLALQIGLVTVVVWLFRWEEKRANK